MIERYRAEIVERETHGGEMVSHMMTLFDEVLIMQPKLIVELGVWKGMSTFALERAAKVCGAKMISVDRDDCSAAVHYAEFIQADDLEFAKDFGQFCGGVLHIDPLVDVLLIDTSHTYQQTWNEIGAWLPWMAPTCKLVFHDTNPSPAGWNKAAADGRYGVAEAISFWLKRKFPWETSFSEVVGRWSIRHNPHYMGLTIVERTAQSD